MFHRQCTQITTEAGDRNGWLEKKERKAKQRCSHGDMAKSQRFQESISANRIVHAPRIERNTTTAGLLAISNDVSFDILCIQNCRLKTIVARSNSRFIVSFRRSFLLKCNTFFFNVKNYRIK